MFYDNMIMIVVVCMHTQTAPTTRRAWDIVDGALSVIREFNYYFPFVFFHFLFLSSS